MSSRIDKVMNDILVIMSIYIFKYNLRCRIKHFSCNCDVDKPGNVKRSLLFVQPVILHCNRDVSGWNLW